MTDSKSPQLAQAQFAYDQALYPTKRIKKRPRVRRTIAKSKKAAAKPIRRDTFDLGHGFVLVRPDQAKWEQGFPTIYIDQSCEVARFRRDLDIFMRRACRIASIVMSALRDNWNGGNIYIDITISNGNRVTVEGPTHDVFRELVTSACEDLFVAALANPVVAFVMMFEIFDNLVFFVPIEQHFKKYSYSLRTRAAMKGARNGR